MEAYDLYPRLKRMDKAQILYPVLADFADLDVRPQTVGNEAMGYMFEELLRKFSEMSNETAGEHYTPREIIRLMVNLLLDADEEALTSPAPVRTVYDPAAGTGGCSPSQPTASPSSTRRPRSRCSARSSTPRPGRWPART